MGDPGDPAASVPGVNGTSTEPPPGVRRMTKSAGLTDVAFPDRESRELSQNAS
jgi:hypothetical protein